MRRVIVDMSMTILHHGHVRLLKRASKLGYVIVGLTTDEDIFENKGFVPKLTFENRREIALAIRWVDEVIECPWPIDEIFLNLHNIDFLVRGDMEYYGNDYKNPMPLPESRIVLFPRTPGISSAILRGDL